MNKKEKLTDALEGLVKKEFKKFFMIKEKCN